MGSCHVLSGHPLKLQIRAAGLFGEYELTFEENDAIANRFHKQLPYCLRPRGFGYATKYAWDHWVGDKKSERCSVILTLKYAVALAWLRIYGKVLDYILGVPYVVSYLISLLGVTQAPKGFSFRKFSLVECRLALANSAYGTITAMEGSRSPLGWCCLVSQEPPMRPVYCCVGIEKAYAFTPVLHDSTIHHEGAHVLQLRCRNLSEPFLPALIDKPLRWINDQFHYEFHAHLFGSPIWIVVGAIFYIPLVRQVWHAWEAKQIAWDAILYSCLPLVAYFFVEPFVRRLAAKWRAKQGPPSVE
jgi:hypothetical protein